MGHPRAGTHYPKSVGEFRTDADCLDYLEWLRWPAGFACSGCGRDTGWRLGDGRYMCSKCGSRTSVTAGTILDRTRTPLTVWFTACWLFATGKDGISALSLKRTLEIGSYQTAWAMLHRLRSVLVRPGRDRLAGLVKVDETFIGGEESGLRGGRARGKKVLTGNPGSRGGAASGDVRPKTATRVGVLRRGLALGLAAAQRRAAVDRVPPRQPLATPAGSEG